MADAKFALFEEDPFHPSLALKQKGEVWTADVGRSYRAIAYREGNNFHWFWIGTTRPITNCSPYLVGGSVLICCRLNQGEYLDPFQRALFIGPDVAHHQDRQEYHDLRHAEPAVGSVAHSPGK